jgi:hypothetical protein
MTKPKNDKGYVALCAAKGKLTIKKLYKTVLKAPKIRLAAKRPKCFATKAQEI